MIRKAYRKMKKRSKKQKIIETIVFLLIIIIIGGGFVYKNFIKNERPEKEEVKEEIPEAKLQIIDLESTSRPYAVMINNLGVARPLQSGLQEAYIIYEMIVEGGITRLLALFLDTETERIGSIRSARHYFLDYAAENDAVYVHHGQSPQATRDFGALGINRINVSNTTGFRDTSLRVSSEHTLFSSIERLEKGMTNIRTERNKDFLLDYSVEPLDLSKIEDAEKADIVKLSYSSSSRVKYEFDKEKGVYKRFFNETPNNDYLTKEQYTFKNLIVYAVQNTTLDGTGRQDLSNIGEGTGYFISNGYVVPISWSKTSRTSQTIYKLVSGEKLTVNDGNTFINIIPKGRDVSFESI